MHKIRLFRFGAPINCCHGLAALFFCLCANLELVLNQLDGVDRELSWCKMMTAQKKGNNRKPLEINYGLTYTCIQCGIYLSTERDVK